VYTGNCLQTASVKPSDARCVKGEALVRELLIIQCDCKEIPIKLEGCGATPSS